MMRFRFLIVCSAILCWACGDDFEEISGGPFDIGAEHAGSCDFPDKGTCDEYAEEQSSPDTSSDCGLAGGDWTGGKCPFEGRRAICMDVLPATRTYAYTEEAADALLGGCAGDAGVKINITEEAPAPGADPMNVGDDADAG
ncbi:MAG: hypothetical protein OEZ06_18520 [Myxococcales bacterium]|nr:hypothetical protein [Myxococcales bacterium]